MKRNLLKKKIKDLAFELTGKKSGIRYWGRTRHTGWYFLVLFVFPGGSPFLLLPPYYHFQEQNVKVQLQWAMSLQDLTISGTRRTGAWSSLPSR